ncbi:MAG: protein TolR [Succinivibrionaceae bacterium]|jgi:biopolymer transport protein TolR|nr:protein TolR [Succinivibrionaceae bacterium]
MSLRKRRRAVAEINVVPYIDVMLVLLVIFIATAPVIMQGVKVDLPQAESKTLDQDLSDPAIIYVDKEGRYSVQTGSNSTPVESIEELTDFIRTFRANHADSPVVVSGDRSTPYNNIVQVMVALKNAGEQSVGLVTEPIDEKKGK